MAFSKNRRGHRLPGRRADGTFKKKIHHHPGGGKRKKRAARRATSTALVRRNPHPLVVANPHRGIRRKTRTHALAGRSAHHIRRRRNPSASGRLRSVGSYIRIGIAGGIGIIIARIGGYLYTKYIAPKVIGADATVKWRVWLNEAARLFFMGLLAVGIERGAKKAGLRPEDRAAFLFGALGEAGRQAIGGVIGVASPTTDRKPYGLDGAQPNAPLAYVLPNGRVMVLANDGRYYPREQMSGVVSADEFGGVVPADRFGGRTRGSRSASY